MPEAEDEGSKSDRQIIDDLLAKLGEHFDAVQIFTSRKMDNGETESFSRGIGNWNTRWGQIERWFRHCQIADDEEARIAGRRNRSE